ncbi:hypothetical protein O6R05_01685 [Peptoniphilus equinus]|uniref:Uncharacterized protein n=1 Tax=Peptoniphilus equinus TaxID=3016343 RepID=A0ABY7QWK0_9FIRM|nr:hypothetical protein [Peptoniphilus equinus]WBW50278.1 hypothetical protein O6R05_01685 [Peptoniphilus equinus]
MDFKTDAYLHDDVYVRYISALLAKEGIDFTADDVASLLIERRTVGGKSLESFFLLYDTKRAMDYITELAKTGAPLTPHRLMEINRLLLQDVIPGGIYRTFNTDRGTTFMELHQAMDRLFQAMATMDVVPGGWFTNNFMTIAPFGHRNAATAAMVELYYHLIRGDAIDSCDLPHRYIMPH